MIHPPPRPNRPHPKHRISPTKAWPTVIALLLAALANPAIAQDSQSSGESADLLQRVRQAYRDTKTYRAEVTYSINMEQGEWHRSRSTTMNMAYQRRGTQLRLRRADMTIQVQGDTLRLMADSIAERYLETRYSPPLTYATLTDLLPALASPTPLGLAMLLSDNPLAVMMEFSPPEVSERDGKLVLKGDQGTMTLELNPETSLIRKATLDMDMAGQNVPPGTAVQHIYEINVQAHNQPLPDSAFALDTGDRDAVDSIYAFIGQPDPSETGAGPPHPLRGQPLPSMTLHDLEGNAVSLDKVDADVIVLDFFATWCMPCRIWLPQLEKVQQWAKDQDKSVRVFVVSVDQDAEAMRQFWKRAGFSLTLLVPENMAGIQNAFRSVQTNAYGVQSKQFVLPTTAITRRGKVVKVHTGVGPQMRQRLEDDIDAALAVE